MRDKTNKVTWNCNDLNDSDWRHWVAREARGTAGSSGTARDERALWMGCPSLI